MCSVYLTSCVVFFVIQENVILFIQQYEKCRVLWDSKDKWRFVKKNNNPFGNILR